MNIFDDLKGSLEEAVEIKEGRQAATRVTRYEVANGKRLSGRVRPSDGKANTVTQQG